jgi:pimeloyl-ACP methyl ester carboxylesterase
MAFKKVVAAAAVTAVAALNGAGPISTASAVDTPTIVLVHGAWANGSSWARVVPLLQAWGLDVVAVHNPLSTFEADVAATRRVIEAQKKDVILVGHSYGGAVITEAGTSAKVRALVYVAAFAPSDGESISSIVGSSGTPEWFSEMRADAGGMLTWSPVGFRARSASF